MRRPFAKHGNSCREALGFAADRWCVGAPQRDVVIKGRLELPSNLLQPVPAIMMMTQLDKIGRRRKMAEKQRLEAERLRGEHLPTPNT